MIVVAESLPNKYLFPCAILSEGQTNLHEFSKAGLQDACFAREMIRVSRDPGCPATTEQAFQLQLNKFQR